MSLETIKAQTLVTFFRSGGPGGQHRNKTETAVRLVHGPTGVTVVAADERSQRRNLTLAFDRLRRKLIARSAVPRRRIPTRTPTSVREARLDAKRRRAQKKIFRRRPDET
jgi:ribosome-associated protein